MKYNTLKYAGVERSFADVGIEHGSDRLELVPQGADTFAFTQVDSDLDAPDFPFEAVVQVYKGRDSATGNPDSFSGGEQVFVGKRTNEQAEVRAAGEAVRYTFSGPWYDCEHVIFQQQTGSWVSTGVGLRFQSELILFTRLDASGFVHAATSGEQIQVALQFVIDSYAAQGLAAPFQIGAVAGGANFPAFPTRPMLVSDVIHKCLEFFPDHGVSFDYSTTPPTVVVTAEGAAVTVPFRGTPGCRITPRHDIVPASVIILYRITETHDGQEYVNFVKDKFGPHGANSALDPDAGLRVLTETIDLFGATSTSITGELDCEPLAIAGGTVATKRAWWASLRGGEDKVFGDTRARFQNAAGVAVPIPDASAVDESGNPVNLAAFPNRLVDGAVHPWMRLGNTGAGVVAKRVKITAPMTYGVYDDVAAGGAESAVNGNRTKFYSQKEHSCAITVTNGVTGTYRTTATASAGEAVPVGLAQAIYTSLAKLQYEGEHISVADVASSITPANSLNISGGRPEWETMAAVVRRVGKCLSDGTCEVSIGPSTHLNSGQFMALLRMWRYRRDWVNPLTRETGQLGGGGTFGIVKNSPKANSSTGAVVDGGGMALAPATGGNTTRVESDPANQQFVVQVVTTAGANVAAPGKIEMKLSDVSGGVAKFRDWGAGVKVLSTGVGAGSGGGAAYFRIKEIGADCYRCHACNPDGTGIVATDVYVLKSYKLRNGIASAVLDGQLVNYAYDSTYVARVAVNTVTGESEAQVVDERILIDDVIMASACAATASNFLTGNPPVSATFCDTNYDGHAWSSATQT